MKKNTGHKLLLFFAVFVVLIVCGIGAPVLAAEQQTGNKRVTEAGFTYEITGENTVALEKVSADAAVSENCYCIPSKIKEDGKDYTVTSILASAFGEVTVTGIVIPDAVTTIDEAAFEKASTEPVSSVQETNEMNTQTVKTEIAAQDKDTPADPSVQTQESQTPVIYCNVDSEAQKFAKSKDWQCVTDALKVSVTKNAIQTGEETTVQVVKKPDFFDSSVPVTWHSGDSSVASVGSDGKVTGIKAGNAVIDAECQGLKASVSLRVSEKTPDEPEAVAAPVVTYQVHGQNYAWQDWKKDGETAGTLGKGLQLEALKMKLTGDNLSQDSGIEYRAHVADIGWQDWVAGDAQIGTTGRKLEMEAVSMRLTGAVADQYDIYYRVHIKNYGWLDWAKNGADAGTTGLAYRMEAIEVQLVAKGGEAPGSEARPYFDRSTVDSTTSLSYRSHIQDIGWTGYVNSGSISGTTGRSLRVEALQMKLAGDELQGSSINYDLHVQDIGWQGWRSNDQVAGTTGQRRQVEAIQMSLSGTAADFYDIYYRVHCQDYGWLDWAKNGAYAGTSGGALRMEAYQVVLVPKNGAAPGPTATPYHEIHRKKDTWVPEMLQLPELPTGGESVALTIDLYHYGVTLPKTTIASSYMDYSGNAAYGFTGDPFSWGGGCCFPPVIVDAANRALSDWHSPCRAYNISGTDFETLYNYMFDGKPVIVWTTSGMANPQGGGGVVERDGIQYGYYYPEHCVVLFDYNRSNNTVIVSDPEIGYAVRDASEFAGIYNQIGRYAVVIQ
ncbi:MAG: C39 family peptidase [Eubacteriaceae bacterium]|nr:C39 family peptidase [Eubacteriaceae bacterium]